VKRWWEWGEGYPLAILAVAVVTVACLPLRGTLSVQTFMLFYVPVVVGVARLAGTGPSTLASILSVALLDVLFTEPYLRLTVSNPAEWIALAVFLVIALIAGQQTGQMREREQAAVRRQRELTLLNRLSFHVVSDKSIGTAAELTVSQVATLLEAKRAAVYAREPGRTDVSLLAAAGEECSDGEREFVDWVMRADKAIGLPPTLGASVEPRPVSVGPTEALEGKIAEGVYLPLQTTGGLEGVLYACTRFDSETPEEDVRFLVAVANLAGAALERRRLETEAASLSIEREADSLKNTIVSSVSHELKTPLAAATARVSALLEGGVESDAAEVRTELESVSADLARLNASIGDLLDVSRLESDAWRPQPELYEVSEILGTVLSKLPDPQRGRVQFDIPSSVPFVNVDFSQMARALANIVENALAYSLAPEPVRVSATYDTDTVRITVEDRGPGVADAEKHAIFGKFYRGSAAAAMPGGTGLGLAIAREIVESQGGHIHVYDAEPTGARFVVSLPVAIIGAEAE
jgi:two-component system sensor histidine kinase KdpD